MGVGRTRLTLWLVLLVSVGLLLAGLWWIYPPASLVAAGAGGIWAVLTFDFPTGDNEGTG